MTELNVHKRKKEDSLDAIRAKGHVPAICYGLHTDNILVSFDQNEFRKCYREAGTSSIINLVGDLKEQSFVQDMQVHVVSGDIQHVDLKIVATGETTQVDVPVKTKGTAPAVENKLGLLRIAHQELSIEAIPSEVPSEITVDITNLNEVGDNIKVKDLNLPDSITILEDENITLVSISSLQEEDEEDEDGPTLEEVLADPRSDEKEEEKEA